MGFISDWFTDNWGLSEEFQGKILFSIIAFIILSIIRYLALRFSFRKVSNVKSQYYWRNSIINTHNALLIIIVGFIWVEQMDSLGTFL